MKLIIGGAYQGKLDFAREQFHLDEADIFDCSASRSAVAHDGGGAWIDFSKAAITGLEEFAMSCVREGLEAKDVLAANKELWKRSVLICTDISGGLVPCDAEQRAWREMTGRMLVYLGREADEVFRLFCGLPQKLKG